jgi:hypothetical protein
LVTTESLEDPYTGIGVYVDRSSGAVGGYAGGWIWYSSVNTVTDDEWAYVALRARTDASTGWIEVSVNGEAWESVFYGDTSNHAMDSTSPLSIGAWPGGGPSSSYFTHGSIDEVRISTVARSADWNRAQYLSMTRAFYALGDEETAP